MHNFITCISISHFGIYKHVYFNFINIIYKNFRNKNTRNTHLEILHEDNSNYCQYPDVQLLVPFNNNSNSYNN